MTEITPIRTLDVKSKNLKRQIAKGIQTVVPPLVTALTLAGCASSEPISKSAIPAATLTPPATPTVPVTPDKIQQSNAYTYYANPSAKESYNSQGLATEVGKVYPSGSKSTEVFLDGRSSEKRIYFLLTII